MKMVLGALALTALPVCAWAQGGGDVCPIGESVQVTFEGKERSGWIYDGPDSDGACLVVIEGVLFDTEAWIQVGPVAAIDRPVEAPVALGLCTPGSAVEVEWQGQWYDGHVLEGPRPDGSCYISYDGYDSSWDEWVTNARLRPVDGGIDVGGVCIAGRAVEIEWRGQWYPGYVLDGPQPDGSCYITYEGYDSSWDEWATPERLRPVHAGANAGGLCVPGLAVSVEWQGQWYPGHVVDGPRSDGQCYITYDGYDSSWDEWVTPSRLSAN